MTHQKEKPARWRVTWESLLTREVGVDFVSAETSEQAAVLITERHLRKDAFVVAVALEEESAKPG